ncbi:hypothetical protein A33Q_0532 [Indibacter alkaliphilus LW1]|uniref:TolB-like 6-blade propeller-like n=1 Tax=Indibacter alkaliphilus (strain CCUG 57479 / KCTC 22604 / LW1) TaxID=1189612 RepID=S2DKR0_INDAL|nr:hypothetical protein [Indibacter alkaliphilus]EOZ99527.1 hypothetical protein A33Q_0532 [Indibacter alkaliphilus LW1]
MKIKARFSSFSTALSLLAVLSCDPKDPIPESPVIWEKAIGIEEGIFNAKVINGELYVASPSRIYPEATLQGPNDFVDLSLFMQSSFPYRLPISDKLMVALNPSEISLLPTGNSSEKEALKINLRQLDPEFLRFPQIGLGVGDQLSIDAKGNVLIPYLSKEGERQKNNPDFLWLKTSVEGGKVKILDQKFLKEEYLAGSSAIRWIRTFDDFIRVTIEGKTFDIDEFGNIDLRFDQYTKSVQVGNEIVTFASEYVDRFPFQVFKSDLSGKNSALIRTYENDRSPLVSQLMWIGTGLATIDGKLIFYNADALYLVDLTEDSILFTELDNTGLERAYISSIQLLDNSTVFVASACTDSHYNNCGGFYKPLDKFFTPKK